MPLCKKWYKMHVCKFPIWKKTYKTWDIGDKHVWTWWWKAQGRYQRRYLVFLLFYVLIVLVFLLFIFLLHLLLLLLLLQLLVLPAGATNDNASSGFHRFLVLSALRSMLVLNCAEATWFPSTSSSQGTWLLLPTWNLPTFPMVSPRSPKCPLRAGCSGLPCVAATNSAWTLQLTQRTQATMARAAGQTIGKLICIITWRWVMGINGILPSKMLVFPNSWHFQFCLALRASSPGQAWKT